MRLRLTEPRSRVSAHAGDDPSRKEDSENSRKREGEIRQRMAVDAAFIRWPQTRPVGGREALPLLSPKQASVQNEDEIAL